MITSTILILEDDPGRTSAMLDRLRTKYPDVVLHVCDSAGSMNECLDQYLSTALAIALDHDLPISYSKDGTVQDHGNGVDVVRHLVKSSPTCPVLIHSTNVTAADTMEAMLREAAWTMYRVVPYGDLEWIDELWFPTMKRAIANYRRSVSRSG